MNDRGKPEIRQTSVAVMVDEDVGLVWGQRFHFMRPRTSTCPFQIPMYRMAHMQVTETLRHIQQLRMASVSVKSESGQPWSSPERPDPHPGFS